MPHIRKQVREAAKMVFTGLSLGGEPVKVFSGRVAPIGKDDMPCINMLLLDESSDWDAAPNIARNGRLIAEGRVIGRKDDLLDDLDELAALIEARAYAADTTFDGLLQNIGTPTTQIDLPEPDQGNAQGVGVIRILFPVTYRTPFDNPTTRA